MIGSPAGAGGDALPRAAGGAAGNAVKDGGLGTPAGSSDTLGGSSNHGGAEESGAGGGAGTSNDAGAGGDFVGACQAPLAECDTSTFTRCETDTSSSPQHCGGCKHLCAGACAEGRCLEPTTLIEQLLPDDRGLARVGDAFYALSSQRLYTFEEGQQIPLELTPMGPNLKTLEAAPNTLYLGDDQGHWWSANARLPLTLVDEGVTALDAKYMDGAFYWVERDQIVRVKYEGVDRARYCALPAPPFEVESVTLARPAPNTIAVFRRGDSGSDIVRCAPWQRASLDEPVAGSRVALRDTIGFGGAEGGKLYWTEGTRLLRADAEDRVDELFSAPGEEVSIGPFVVVENSLVLAFEKAFSGGLHVIALDASLPPRTLGMIHEPGSLTLDELSERICYAELAGNRVVCLASSDLAWFPAADP